MSDEKTEYEINDRLSYLSFIGLELCDDVPDARTIWDFKERIEVTVMLVLGCLKPLD